MIPSSNYRFNLTHRQLD